MNSDWVRRAMMRASVVLPTPGGPQKIIDGISSDSMMRRSTFPGPSRCFCPANSSSVSGRRRAASGWGAARSNMLVCLSIFRSSRQFFQKRSSRVISFSRLA